MRSAIALGFGLMVSCALGQTPADSGGNSGPVAPTGPRPAANITRLAHVDVGDGLADRHPGDQGIGGDPHVVFCEDFDSRDPLGVWTDRSHGGGTRLSDKGPHAGNFALVLGLDPATEEGAHVFKQLTLGQDTLFVRFYVKAAAEDARVRHFVQITADEPKRSIPLGGAGVCPNGGARFSTSLEQRTFSGTRAWSLESYWCEMAISDDGKYWGNAFEPEEPVAIVPGRWTCVEVMVRANTTPVQRDGAQAIWIDGRLAAAFEGYRWRTDPKLKLNGACFRCVPVPAPAAAVPPSAPASGDVLAQAPDAALAPPPASANVVMIDDVVVATRYIGPRRPLPAPTPTGL